MYHAWLRPPQIQLFDLENDPWEFNDIAGDPRYAHVKEKLLNELYAWQEKTDDPLRFPEKLKELTTEHDTIETSRYRESWQYPAYLYEK